MRTGSGLLHAWRRALPRLTGIGRSSQILFLSTVRRVRKFLAGQTSRYRHRVLIPSLALLVIVSAGVWFLVTTPRNATPSAAQYPAPDNVAAGPSTANSTPTQGPDVDTSNAPPLSRETIYERTLPSMAWLVCRPRNARQVTGTAWVIDADRRYLITNEHVVANDDQVAVYFPEHDATGHVVAERDHYFRHQQPAQARVLRRDARRDLALVRLEDTHRRLASLPLASTSPRPGQEVHTVGNPGASGALWVYTSGTVRQVYHASIRTEDGSSIEANVVETQSPTNPGDSGGPMVNDRGEVVAVVQSHSRDARLVTVAVDVSEIRDFLATLTP